MTVNSRVIKTFLAWAPEATDVPLLNGLRVQILPTIEDIPRARKYHFAAFIASESLLAVWDDDPSNVVKRATTIESQLMELVWHTGETGDDEDCSKEKDGAAQVTIDSESGEVVPERRLTNLMNTILVAFTLVIVTVLLGLACRSLATEIAVDGSYMRLAFLALVPVQIFFTLVGCLAFFTFVFLIVLSSLHRLLSVALLNASVLCARCNSIQSSFLQNAHPAFGRWTYPM